MVLLLVSGQRVDDGLVMLIIDVVVKCLDSCLCQWGGLYGLKAGFVKTELNGGAAKIKPDG